MSGYSFFVHSSDRMSHWHDCQLKYNWTIQGEKAVDFFVFENPYFSLVRLTFSMLNSRSTAIISRNTHNIMKLLIGHFSDYML